MQLNKSLVTISSTVLLMSMSSFVFAQSESQAPEPAVSELTKEIVTEDDQKKRKPPRQATNNVGLKNGTDVICKKSKKKGTRLRVQKVCKTRAQWDVERLNAKQGLDEIKAQTSIGQAR